MLQGLLECQEDEIRECFKQSLMALTKSHDAGSIRLWMLRMLSRSFESASEFESRQYFDLFIELIEDEFQASGAEEFNPQELLG